MELKNIPCPLCTGLRWRDLVWCCIEERDTPLATSAARASRAFSRLDLVACPTCSLVYLNPMPILSPQEEKENYGEQYFQADYMRFYAQDGGDGLVQSNEDFSFRLRLIEKFSKPGKLLDVGCASGGFMRAARQQGWQAWGVEVSEQVSGTAREQFGLEVFSGTLAEADFEPDFFDCVCLGDILEHVMNPASFLAQAAKVLKPGGLLYVAMPNAASLYFSFFLKLARVNHKNYFVLPHHVIHYTPKTLKRMLQQAGFDVCFKALSTSRVMHKGFKGIFLNALNLISRLLGRQDRVLMLARKKKNPIQLANILYLSDTGRVIGGGQISLLGLLERLDRKRFRPIVIVPQEGDLSEKIRALGVEVVSLPYRKIKNPLNIAHTLTLYRRLQGLFAQYSVDIVHSNTAGGLSLLGALAAFHKKIPFLWHVRVSESGGLDDIAQAMLSTRVVMISQAEMKRFPWLDFLAKGVLVYNGVDLKVFCPYENRNDARSKLKISVDELLVGTVGRFHPIKGYEYFVEAAQSILREVPQVKFIIVGLEAGSDNPYFKNIQALIQRKGLFEKFVILGPQSDIPAVLSALDVFVLTSRDELFGRVLVEAMGCKVPVAAFDVGGVKEIVSDSVTGYVVPSRDASGLGRRVVELLRKEKVRSRFGEEGSKRAEAYFSIETHVERVESLYDSVRV